MRCPKCEAKQTRVTDSRVIESNIVFRRRRCKECGYRFTSYELTAKEKAKIEQAKKQ